MNEVYFLDNNDNDIQLKKLQDENNRLEKIIQHISMENTRNVTNRIELEILQKENKKLKKTMSKNFKQIMIESMDLEIADLEHKNTSNIQMINSIKQKIQKLNENQSPNFPMNLTIFGEKLISSSDCMSSSNDDEN